MLKKVKELLGAPIAATDGEIGEVHEILFDDEHWSVHHVVLKTGGGLSGRKVRISPEAIRRPESTGCAFGVALTRHEVMRGPGIDSDMPVSGKYEEASAGFYRRSLDAEKGSAGELRQAEREARRSHLRSSNEVIGYSVHGLDGLLGHVDDLLFDDEIWRVTTLLVDAREWRPGEKVRLSPESIRAVDWKTREVRLNVRRQEVEL